MLRPILLLSALALLYPACPEADPAAPGLDATVDVGTDTSTGGGADGSTDAGTDSAIDVTPTCATRDLLNWLPDGEVVAGVVDAAEQLLGGLKAEGQVGDLKIANGHVAFIVEGARQAGGWREQGGHVVDAVAGVDGADLYGELFGVWNLDIFYPDAVEVISDGCDGVAQVRVSGQTGPFDLGTGFLEGLLGSPPPNLQVTIDYSLGPNDRALRQTITLTNPGDEAVTIDALMMGSHGDGAKLYGTTGTGWDTESASGAVLKYLGAVSPSTSYAYAADGEELIMAFTTVGMAILQRGTFAIPAGGTHQQRALIAASPNGSNGLDAWWRGHFAPNLPAEVVAGAVDLPEGADPAQTYVVAWDGEDLLSLAPVSDDGSFAMELEEGPVELEVYSRGFMASGRIVHDVIAGSPATVTLSLPLNGAVTVSVDDIDGNPLAARVSFVREGATEAPVPPDAATLYPTWGGGVTDVAYANRGPATVYLPPGEYRAVASRGLSWELQEQLVTVTAGGAHSLGFELTRAVDTSGWLAADLHIHAMYSPDSDVPYEVRAIQAATDDLDLPLITEHLAVGKLGDAPARMGVDDVVIQLAANEITTLTYGHFIAFPAAFEPTATNRGAIYPLDLTPPEMFEVQRGSNPAEQIITIAHPRTSFQPFAYFDYAGLDSATMQVSNPEVWSLDFDTIEVFNSGCNTDGENGLSRQDWINMTSHGVHKALIAGSDTHAEEEPGGVPRTWIQVDPSDGRSDPATIVTALKARRAFVSCGPFVSFAASDGQGLGELAAVDSNGDIEFQVKVQAPTWIGVDTVRLLENGLVIDSVDVSAPGDPVVRFDGPLSATPTDDAWYAVEVLGSGSLQPVNKNGPPYAMTNDIRVDADGDGSWTPPAL